MINEANLNKKQLIRSITIILLFLVAFFIGNIHSQALYESFDFDSYAKRNYGYWSSECENDVKSSNVEACVEKTIASQRKFYTTLYKLLAKYEKKGLIINDNIIIATVWYQLTPATFADDPTAYQSTFDGSSAYANGDYDTIENYDVTATESETEIDSLLKETDTLKLLLKNMIGYDYTCYGVYDATATKNSDGTTSYTCPNGGSLSGTKCENVVKTGATDYKEHLLSIIKNNAILRFFGAKSDTMSECENEVNSKGIYSSNRFEASKNPKVHEELYYDFLVNSKYFDNKAHLQSYFADVLDLTHHSKMSDLTDDEMTKYDEQIKSDRQHIADNIKEIASHYDINKSIALATVSSKLMWWPIGSETTTEDNGITYAIDNPYPTTITAPYGEVRSDHTHTGIDIAPAAANGVVNVIAAKDGIVTSVTTGCISGGDQTCGGGYGNHIMISHPDGTYTLYAHLHEDTITVKVNDSVKQGQVIGKVGSSGHSTGTHLHFEVRTDATTTTNPTDYVSMENPRPSGGSSSDLAQWLINLEGGPTSGSNYKVICNSDDIPTVGHGITLIYNQAYFKKYGINLTTSNDFYNYCGKSDDFPVSVVDQIYGDLLKDKGDSIRATLANSGITLTDYQIDALVSTEYNCGNIESFAEAYKTYGVSESLCTNWWNEHYVGGKYRSALIERRKKECHLFLTGDYNLGG